MIDPEPMDIDALFFWAHLHDETRLAVDAIGKRIRAHVRQRHEIAERHYPDDIERWTHMLHVAPKIMLEADLARLELTALQSPGDNRGSVVWRLDPKTLAFSTVASDGVPARLPDVLPANRASAARMAQAVAKKVVDSMVLRLDVDRGSWA